MCAEVRSDEVEVLLRKTLSLGGSTRATAYSMSNKIITGNGKIFVAWLDHVSEIRVCTYDMNRARWGPVQTLGQGVDNHSGPAIAMDSQGYLYAVFGPHGGPFQFRRSLRPHDAEQWGETTTFGQRATYPSLVCAPDDVLHCAYRGGSGPPNRLMVQRRSGDGSWSDPLEVVHADVPDGYTQYGNALAVGQDGTLHLGFHIYDMHPESGKALGYLRSRDGGRSWANAEDREIELPATPGSPCFLEQGPELDLRIGNLVLDADGLPWLLAHHLEKEPQSATLWHHDRTCWQARDLLAAVRAVDPDRQIANDPGTLTFDRDGVLYVTLVTENPPGGWGHPSGEILLLTSSDRGESFAGRRLSADDPNLPNWQPSLERPTGPGTIGAPALLYTHGGPGEGCTEGNATEVVFLRLGK